ncbi:MAG: cytochrome bc1 complex diheme cytochrome c subunit [Acidimicrobiales bacterium]
MSRARLLPPLALVAFCSAVGLTFFASSPGAQAATTAAPSTPPPTISLAPYSLQNGHALFQANCASCHGNDAAGSNRAPNLVGLGPATIDFWVSTGRMPLATPSSEALPKQPRFTPPEQRAIVKYVSSLGPGGPGIPAVNLNGANVGNGFSLFVTNCAGCHAVTGVGDALSNGLSAPSLFYATPTQIAEAIRTGPSNMPRFTDFQFNQSQLNDIVAYVSKDIQHPDNRGGNGLGNVGPITEGLAALFLGLGSMLVILYWIGDRA